jgi:hypothetical protein
VTGQRVRSVTRRELRVLFPSAAIDAERACGFTKSFIVVGECAEVHYLEYSARVGHCRDGASHVTAPGEVPRRAHPRS